MASGKMHADEIVTDVSLVRRLLAAQFPQWTDLTLELVRSAGTDNAIYKLGDDMAVRLPRVDWAIAQVDKEQQWLPRLASHLPLAIPLPVGLGMPGEDYPWRWSIYRWLEGETATVERLDDLSQAARELAQFIVALQRIDAREGPPPGPHNFFRGEPLAERDEQTRSAIASLERVLDAPAATAAWDAALRSTSVARSAALDSRRPPGAESRLHGIANSAR